MIITCHSCFITKILCQHYWHHAYHMIRSADWVSIITFIISMCIVDMVRCEQFLLHEPERPLCDTGSTALNYLNNMYPSLDPYLSNLKVPYAHSRLSNNNPSHLLTATLLGGPIWCMPNARVYQQLHNHVVLLLTSKHYNCRILRAERLERQPVECN